MAERIVVVVVVCSSVRTVGGRVNDRPPPHCWATATRSRPPSLPTPTSHPRTRTGQLPAPPAPPPLGLLAPFMAGRCTKDTPIGLANGQFALPAGTTRKNAHVQSRHFRSSRAHGPGSLR